MALSGGQAYALGSSGEARPPVARSSSGRNVSIVRRDGISGTDPSAVTGFKSDATVSPLPSVSDDPLQRALGTIVGYANLTDGWDGPGSSKPRGDNLRAVAGLLIIAHVHGALTAPSAMITSSGTPGLYWDTEDCYADIEVEDAVSFSIFARSKRNGKEVFLEDVPIGADAANVIRNVLQEAMA